MSVFRILVLVVALAFLLIWFLIYRKQVRFLDLLQSVWFQITNRDSDLLLRIRSATQAILIITLTLMALTGFLPVLIAGNPINGIWLIIHVTVAPVFVLAVTVYILVTVHSMRFTLSEWQYLRGSASERKDQFWQKVHFWLGYLAVLAAVVSILLMFYPLFGTDTQHDLLNIHRYSTLIISIIVLNHFFLNRINEKNN